MGFDFNLDEWKKYMETHGELLAAERPMWITGPSKESKIVSLDNMILSMRETEGLDEREVRKLISEKLQVIGDRLMSRFAALKR